MKLLLFFATGLLAPIVALANPAAEINSVLADRLLDRAHESIRIVRLGSSASDQTVIYRHQDDEPLVPASNLKVVTTSAALDRLGSQFTFRTKLVLHDGDLILIGDGDPSFGDAELLNKSGWDVTTVFKNWAAGLRKLNLPPLRNIIVDDSIFEENFLHPDWPADQVDKRYVAEVAGMNLNANCVDFLVRTTLPGEAVRALMDPPTRYVTFRNLCITGGENAIGLSRSADGNQIEMRGQARQSTEVPVSVTIHDPPMFAATVLAETLEAAGVRHSGDIHRDRTIRPQMNAAHDKSWILLAQHETPLEIVLARANKDSMNLYAECLCKRLGAEVSGQSGSWQNGVPAVEAFLQRTGASTDQFHLVDGCGLSKENQISAAAMVDVLAYDFFSPNAAVFRASLAVAGVDGTLKDRFRGTDLRARVIGKSGFVNGVSSLSGYLDGRDGRTYAFSILINGIPELSNSEIKVLEERIIRAVDNDGATMASVGR